jgi:hypothetical protein
VLRDGEVEGFSWGPDSRHVAYYRR